MGTKGTCLGGLCERGGWPVLGVLEWRVLLLSGRACTWARCLWALLAAAQPHTYFTNGCVTCMYARTHACGVLGWCRSSLSIPTRNSPAVINSFPPAGQPVCRRALCSLTRWMPSVAHVLTTAQVSHATPAAGGVRCCACLLPVRGCTAGREGTGSRTQQMN